MRVVVCPDSFKGSLSAIQVATIISNAFHEVDETTKVDCVPIADGGEGTIDAFYESIGGTLYAVIVQNPMMEKIEACYLVLPDGTCVIEMAQSTGLHLVKEELRDPLVATSYGMGEMIRHALDAGYRRFVVGIGGSATNDGGYGLLRALGMQFFDEQGKELAVDVLALQKVARIDTSEFDKRVRESTWTLACDVDNPLLGETGATAVFGPQKGVTKGMRLQLEQALAQLAKVVEKQVGFAVHEVAGAGAAGGVGMALLAYFPVALKRGIDVVSRTTGLVDKIAHADYVITGEGYSDHQTLNGKAPLGIAKLAQQLQIPVVLLSGKVAGESRQALQTHFSIIMAAADEQMSTAFAMDNAVDLLFARAKKLAQQLKETL
ncbi:glycerate kinase [Lysinibacillus sp. NPDC096418]|uniref:glycerate kinase n=1 Tax=Lysinibacillus sp. NPDC096418 TaxID=3364138 RepID=UPI0038067D26